MDDSIESEPDAPSGDAETVDTSTAREESDPLGAGIVTVSLERDLASDAAGEVLSDEFTEAGHEIAMREHVGPEHDTVQSIVSRMIDRDDVDVVLTAGAASVEPDDITIEAVAPLFEKELPSFSELFTILAYEASGTRVLAARAIAGVTEQTLIFCLPGNADAARLAAAEIIVPEIDHLVDLARVDAEGEEVEEDDKNEGDEGTSTAESNGGEDA